MEEPKSVQERETLCCTGATPAPLKVSVGVLEALLENDNVPLAVPEICGAKVRVNGTLCPAFRVTGKVIPLRLNSAPLTPEEETVTDAPLALRVLVRVDVVPTVTLPKFKAVGERLS
jgi:hypothetical protein